VNDVEPQGRGKRVRLVRIWDWYTDLGVGAIFLGIGVVVGVLILASVVDAKLQPSKSACQSADPLIENIRQISADSRGSTLPAADVAQLRIDGTKLTVIAKGAAGEQQSSLSQLAALASSAEAGQPFDADHALGRVDQACVITS
jgi:hypothetical protein